MFCPCSDLQLCPGGQRRGSVAAVAQIPRRPRRERWLARPAPAAFTVLRLCGAAYLLYLGVRALAGRLVLER